VREISEEPLVIEGIVAKEPNGMFFRNGKPVVAKLKVSDYFDEKERMK